MTRMENKKMIIGEQEIINNYQEIKKQQTLI